MQFNFWQKSFILWNEEPVEILVLSTGEATVIDMYDDLIPENPKTGVATYFGVTMLAVAVHPVSNKTKGIIKHIFFIFILYHLTLALFW